MLKSTPVQAAQRLIKVLGGNALAQAAQNVLDFRAAGDLDAAQYWLDVVDIVTAVQGNANADTMRSAPFRVRNAVTIAQRAKKLRLE